MGAMPAWGAASGATFSASALKGSVRPIAPLMALSASMIPCRANEGHQYPKPCEHRDSAALEFYGSVFRRHSEAGSSLNVLRHRIIPALSTGVSTGDDLHST